MTNGDFDSLKLPGFEPAPPARTPPPAPPAAKKALPPAPATAPPPAPPAKALAPAPSPPAAPEPPAPPSLPPKSKVSARPAEEVARHCRLSPAARALLKDQMTTRGFLDALIQKRLWADGLRFLAHALPKREAVWWACQCTRQAYGRGATLATTAALEAAERWAAKPTDEHRAAAWVAAAAADLGTPAGCAAAAAHWSGGDNDAAGEQLTARAVAGSVLLAAVLTEPEQFAETAGQFLSLGVAVAGGASRWKSVSRKG